MIFASSPPHRGSNRATWLNDASFDHFACTTLGLTNLAGLRDGPPRLSLTRVAGGKAALEWVGGAWS